MSANPTALAQAAVERRPPMPKQWLGAKGNNSTAQAIPRAPENAFVSRALSLSEAAPAKRSTMRSQSRSESDPRVVRSQNHK